MACVHTTFAYLHIFRSKYIHIIHISDVLQKNGNGFLEDVKTRYTHTQTDCDPPRIQASGGMAAEVQRNKRRRTLSSNVMGAPNIEQRNLRELSRTVSSNGNIRRKPSETCPKPIIVGALRSQLFVRLRRTRRFRNQKILKLKNAWKCLSL